MTEPDARSLRDPSMLRRAAPILLIVAGLGASWALGWWDYVSWPALAAHQAWLRDAVAARPILSAIVYGALYIIVTALSLPGGAVLTLTGGFLFGTTFGATLTVPAATAGATLLFLAARTAFARPVAERAGPFLARVRPGLERDGFSYLLALRLVPLLPFWLVNIVPGLVGMRLAPYMLATLIGIIPGTVVYASIGSSLGAVLAAGAQPDPRALLAWDDVLPRIGLALLALAPVIWRYWKRRRRKDSDD